MTTLESSLFASNSNLNTIHVLWQTPITINENVFASTTYTNAKLYIPGGTKAVYQATSSWNKFANILPTSFEVTLAVTTGGSVTMGDTLTVSNDTQSRWVEREKKVYFDILEDDNSDLASVVLNGEDVTEQLVEGRLTIESLEDDADLNVTFAILPRYTVTASVTGNGTATVADEEVISGRSTTVTITAGEGYELATVMVNGEDRTEDVVEGVLSLKGITEDQQVEVTFQKLRFVVTATTEGDGTVTLSDENPEWDDDVVVTLVPAEHSEVLGITVNGEDRTSDLADNALTLENVRENYDIVAKFRLQRFGLTATSNDGGTVSLSADVAEWGTSVTVTVLPEEEHELVSLTVNGTDVTEEVVNGQYTIVSVEGQTEVVATFREITEATITFTSALQTTYCSKHGLDFSNVEGLEAYIIPSYDQPSEQLTALRVKSVPAGMGILLKASRVGTYKVPYTETTAYNLNLLTGVTEEVTLNETDGEKVNYRYSESEAAFLRIGESSVQPAATAYLQLPAQVANAETLRLVLTGEEAGPKGDVNGDGKVNISDVTKLVNIILGKEKE